MKRLPRSLAKVLFCSAAALLAAPAPAQSDSWVLESRVVSTACGQPLVTYFTTADGRQIEANRLSVSADSVVWVQRAFFADGSPIFESEIALAIATLAERLVFEDALEFRVAGSFVGRKLVQGAGGSLTYQMSTEGADITPSGPVRVDAGHQKEDRVYRIMPNAPSFALKLSIRNSPCTIAWVWRQEAPVAVATSAQPLTDSQVAASDQCISGGEASVMIRPDDDAVELYDAERDSWTPIVGEEPLLSCAVVRTGPTSKATIVAESNRFGSMRMLLPPTTVIQAPGVGDTFGLRDGSILVEGDDIAADGYRFALGATVISGQGSEFILSHDSRDGVDTIIIKEGALTATAGDARRRLGSQTILRVTGTDFGPTRAMPPELWQGIMSVGSADEFRDLMISLRDLPPVETEPVAGPTADGTASVSVIAPPPGEGATAASADQKAEVNRLIVEARKAWDSAARLTGEARSEALRETLERLSTVVDDYPGSDHAVTLVGGGEVAGVSIPDVMRALDHASDGDVPFIDVPDGSPIEDFFHEFRQQMPRGELREGTGEVASDSSTLPDAVGPHRLIMKTSLLRESKVTAEGRFRFGVRYLPEIRPFLSAYAMNEPTGSLVLAVTEGSPAAAAGILPGDMIVRFGGREIERPSQLAAIIEETPSAIGVDVEAIRVGGGPEDLRSLLKKRAESGDRSAIAALGELAYNGLENQQDRAEAARLFRQAADLGEGVAAYRLGLMNMNGEGVPLDLREATRLLRRASNDGIAQATYALGVMNWTGRYWTGSRAIRDDIEAVRLFRAAALEGVESSYIYLGIAYQSGRGLAQDLDEARNWYEKAIAVGDASAMTNLGRLYYLGLGVAVDYAEARRLFEQAIEGDVPEAKRLLANMYRDGNGVPIDEQRAESLYREAAEAGISDAMYSLALLMFDSTDTMTLRQAVDWFRRASEKGDGDADYALALAYLGDKGVPRDYGLVAHHLVQAMERGARPAIREMKTNSTAWPKSVLEGVQQRLAQKGLYQGRIDGRFGPGTVRAIDALVVSGGGS